MIFKKIRLYLFAAALAFAFIAGATITHWYHKAKETSALKTVIKEGNKQTGKDEKNLGKIEDKKEDTKIVYRTIYKKVLNAKSNCTYPAGSEFIRLRNEASRAANKAKAH